MTAFIKTDEGGHRQACSSAHESAVTLNSASE